MTKHIGAPPSRTPNKHPTAARFSTAEYVFDDPCEMPPCDGLMEYPTPFIGMAAQFATLDGTEALTEDVIPGAAHCLDLVPEERG